jgi:hypothetical protein
MRGCGEEQRETIRPEFNPATIKTFWLTEFPRVKYARKGKKRGFSIYVTGVLWLSGLLADHRRAYSVSRGPTWHRIPTQTPQNRADRGIIPVEIGGDILTVVPPARI